jgi:N-glycosylase/DNA lyase
MTERTDSAQDDYERAETEAFLKHYLNLGPNLGELYDMWAESDKNFAKKAPKFTGIRILRQDAWEALTGFICSSNNNIARISQMVFVHCCLMSKANYVDGQIMCQLWSIDRPH